MIVRTDNTSQAFLAKEGFASSAFYYAGFPRKISLSMAAYPLLTGAAYLNSRRILKRESPEAVLGMGGYVSVPVGLAAVHMKIPLILHEQNSLAGMANRLLCRWAKAVAVSFKNTRGLDKARGALHCTGLPLRPDLNPQDPVECRQKLDLRPDGFTVLVFGGSQGAKALNRLVTSALPRLAEFRDRWQFIHLTGPAEQAAVEKAYKDLGWRSFVRGYWYDMAALYSAADFVISRSGANTVMELAWMGKPALLVPFPFATDNHQEANARYLESLGLAQVVVEKDLSPERFLQILQNLPAPEALREKVRQGLKHRPPELADAAARVADLVERSGV
jgi:UDP-N-acetylglucosamine--N-acetylmuramyl-(pentapeptide) pyrophosphoryl-undecaprenol N-acetylglucosamine transferase